MKQQLLLLEDVEALGKKGEVVSARPGYTRNFLLPKGFAVIANANMLRKQERLKAEREKQAVVDRQESDALAHQIETAGIETKVKVDPDGHMYGSVSAADIALLFQEKGIPVERKYVQLPRPIKQIGVHKISFKLKEGVLVTADVSILAEGVTASAAAVVAPLPTEEKPEEEKSE